MLSLYEIVDRFENGLYTNTTLLHYLNLSFDSFTQEEQNFVDVLRNYILRNRNEMTPKEDLEHRLIAYTAFRSIGGRMEFKHFDI